MIYMSLYDADPFLLFKTTEFANKLKEDFHNTKIFQDLVQKYVLADHGNHIRFIMKPDVNFAKIKYDEEMNNINKIQSNLTVEQSKQIISDCEKLKKRQKEVGDKFSIPNFTKPYFAKELESFYPYISYQYSIGSA